MDNCIIKTKFPILSQILFWGFTFTLFVLIYNKSLEATLSIKVVLIFFTFDLLIYTISVRDIRIYYFCEDKIIIKAPYRLFSRISTIDLIDIIRVVSYFQALGPQVFKFEFKNGKKYISPHSLSNKNFIEVDDFFQSHDIPFKRQRLFKKFADFDDEK